MFDLSALMRSARPRLFPTFVLLVGFLVVVYALFGQRPLDFDEAGIFNAPYMVAEYSKVSYPVWVSRFPESFDTYWFHPPVYYVVLGTVLKFLSAFYAEGVLPAAIFGLCLYFATTMPAQIHEKYAFVLAAFALVVLSVETQMSHFGARPDMAATLAWLAGLLAMEKGRRSGWKPIPLATGALLTVFGATLHYITVFYALSIVVYAIFAYRDLGRAEFIRALGAMVLGGFVVGIPYLVFFFIPNLENIIKWLTEAETSNLHGHNPLAIFMFKLETHSVWNLFWSPVKLFRSFPGGLQALYIPIGLVSVLGMLLFRQTRVIGWATFPEVFFIYFIADKTQPFYLIPEYLLLFIITFYLAARAIAWTLRRSRFFTLEKPLLFIVTVAVTAYLTTASPKFGHAFRNAGDIQYHWMDVARAAAQTIVGTDAVVGEFIATWYLTGARYWYPEGYGRPLYKPGDEDNYIGSRKILADYNLQAVTDQYTRHVESGGNKKVGVWAGCYANNIFQLIGVVNVPGTAVVFYSKDRPQRIAYYQTNTDTLEVEKFEEAGEGDSVVGTYLCLRPENQPERGRFDFLNRYPTFLEIDGVNPQVLGVFRTSADRFAKMKEELSNDCSLKEVHFGTVTYQSFSEFMDMVPQFHTDVSFFRNVEDAVAAKKRNSRN
ncbi:MAG: hypothetical protein QF787_12320 [Nitrospinota bacterium]|nr:hypothetical protein [Nitrospinota bacterium]